MAAPGKEYGLEDWLACLAREVKTRRSVYPKWVASGRMSQTKADHEIGCMQSLLDSMYDWRDPNKHNPTQSELPI